MKVWVKITTGIRDGIGPGFPDMVVVDDVQIFDYPVVGGVERELRTLRDCNCPDGSLPSSDSFGHCMICGGSLQGRVTTTTTLLKG